MKMKQKHKNTQRRIEKHLSSLAFLGFSLQTKDRHHTQNTQTIKDELKAKKMTKTVVIPPLSLSLLLVVSIDYIKNLLMKINKANL